MFNNFWIGCILTYRFIIWYVDIMPLTQI